MREEDAKMEKITWEMSAEEAVGSSRAAFIKKIYELAKTNDKICLVNCDCSPAGSVQDKFSKDFGDRFIDTGIMEQTACGLAAGLALSGKTVFCQAFGPFLSTRAIEFVYLDGAYNDAPVTYVGTHCGVTAAAGPTHAAVLDIAFMRSMPNMTVISPADAGQIEKVIEAAVDYPHPIYIRCARGEEPLVYKSNDYKYEIGKAIIAREGKDITLIGCGNGVHQCVVAAELLEKEGIDARVIDMHTIAPLDKEVIYAAMRETKGIVTCEDHMVNGGLGSAVAEVVSACEDPSLRIPVKRLGLPVTEFFIQGEPEEVYAYYGYDYNGVCKAAKELLGR